MNSPLPMRERMGSNYFPILDEYSHYYCLTEDSSLAKPHVIILHPGPIKRGLEISSAVADVPYSLNHEQVTNASPSGCAPLSPRRAQPMPSMPRARRGPSLRCALAPF